LIPIYHEFAHTRGHRVCLDDALDRAPSIGRIGARDTKRTIVMKRLAAFVSQKLHALVANVKLGLLLENIGRNSYSHSSLKRTVSSDADRAALLFRVLSQEARFSGGLTGVSI
jgi:hypothetical protein